MAYIQEKIIVFFKIKANDNLISKGSYPVMDSLEQWGTMLYSFKEHHCEDD